MTKTELRKFQQGTLRRFVIVFMLIMFAIGLMVAWIAPSVVVWLLSGVVLAMAGMAFESHLRQTRQLKKPVRVKRSLPRSGVTQ